MVSPTFLPTRAAGLERLRDFVPSAGRDYARDRNHDRGPLDRSNISTLSPYIRHRLISEREVVAAVVAEHGASAAEKFVQEVFWRTYWKGWLELRPSVWMRYRHGLDDLLAEPGADYAAAVAGRTGIDCFDAWVHELAEFGYLHNHTRMWFASIWIFTLRLPWELGADLFYRQLLDGDAASNTLSWRWVAGLQTRGKTYLATADNIARYTDGRFRPAGLATRADAPNEDAPAEPGILRSSESPPAGRVGLLLHDDDLYAESLPFGNSEVVAVAGFSSVAGRSPLGSADLVRDFSAGAVADGLARARRALALGAAAQLLAGSPAEPPAEPPRVAGAATAQSAHLGSRDSIAPPKTALSTQRDSPQWGSTDGSAGPSGGADADGIADAVAGWARDAGVDAVVTPFAPTGPAAEHLDAVRSRLAADGIRLHEVRREWDSLAWPRARRGFFAFREQIPTLLRSQV